MSRDFLCIQNWDRKYWDGEGRNILKWIYRKSILHRVSLRSSVMLKMADSDSLLQRRHSCSLAGVTLVQPIFKYFTISDAIRPTEWQEAASRKHQIAAQSIHLPGTTPYSLIIWDSWVLPEYEMGHDCWHPFTNIQTAFRFYLSPSDKIFWRLNYIHLINFGLRCVSLGNIIPQLMFIGPCIIVIVEE